MEALLKLKLEQQYQEGSGQLMHMVGKMYGRVDARNLPCEQFVRTTYAWVGVNLTSEQLQAILTKSACRTSRGGVDVYKLVSYLVRGAPQPHQPVVGLDREWKRGQHHRTKLPKYSSVTEVEDLIKKKAEQRVLANNNPAAKLLRLFHKVDETGNNTVSKVTRHMHAA